VLFFDTSAGAHSGTKQSHQDTISMADKLVISMKEAAHRLGVSLAFLYDQRTAGKFPTIQLGKRRLVAVADLEAYLVGNRESAHVRKREENGATGKMGRQGKWGDSIPFPIGPMIGAIEPDWRMG